MTNTQTQPNLILIGFCTICAAVLISLAGIIVYAIVHDGSVADQIVGVLQNIILEAVPAICALLGVHTIKAGGLIPAPAEVPPSATSGTTPPPPVSGV